MLLVNVHIVVLLLILLTSPSLFLSLMDTQDRKYIKCFSEIDILKKYIADYIAVRSNEVIALHGLCVIALSGGSMPKLLSDLAERNDIEWDKIYVLFADERCCALDDDDSNYKAYLDPLFQKIALPLENILTIEHYEDPEEAAQLYEARLRHILGDRSIDMVLLGLGPDGHTASLFPHHELLEYSGNRLVQPIFDSPKPPNRRITLTLEALNNNSNEVIFIATGESKAQRLFDILSPNEMTKSSDIVYPPSLIHPAYVTWIIDESAASLILNHDSIDLIKDVREL